MTYRYSYIKILEFFKFMRSNEYMKILNKICRGSYSKSIFDWNFREQYIVEDSKRSGVGAEQLGQRTPLFLETSRIPVPLLSSRSFQKSIASSSPHYEPKIHNMHRTVVTRQGENGLRLLSH
jgi:hypothetical protein